VWIIFYRLSLFIFSFFEYNHQIFWVFLPAGVRILAVLLFGWNGVAGLLIGSIITNDDEHLYHVLMLSAISAFSPMIAIRVCKWHFDISATLEGIKVSQLLQFAVAGSFFNALFSAINFYLLKPSDSFSHFFPMFIGDVIGSFIILILASYILHIIQPKLAQ